MLSGSGYPLTQGEGGVAMRIIRAVGVFIATFLAIFLFDGFVGFWWCYGNGIPFDNEAVRFLVGTSMAIGVPISLASAIILSIGEP